VNVVGSNPITRSIFVFVMIRPVDPSDPALPVSPTDWRDDAIGFFSGQGPLSQAFARAGRHYEARAAQVEMAQRVADALRGAHDVAVEAGTGTGKSFAYLVPAIYHALATQTRVVISTYSIGLQEQLLHKDIPALRESFPVEFKAVLVKGRANYLCPVRLRHALDHSRELFDSEKAEELRRIAEWAKTCKEGSLQEMSEAPNHEVWAMVCAEEGVCSWPGNKKHRECFLARARKAMHEAHVLVVNHHLFFADLAIRRQGGGLLPEYKAVILDEAHEVEEVAGQHLGLRLSPWAFEHWMRRLHTADGEKGLLRLLKRGDMAHAVTLLRDHVERLFLQMHEWAGFADNVEETTRTVPAPIPVDCTVSDKLSSLCHQLKQIEEGLPEAEDEVKAEIQAAIRRGRELARTLRSWLEQELKDQVYWLSLEGRRKKQVVLNAAPVEVGPLLKEELFEQTPAVVMTSATLATGDGLEYFLHRVGCPDADAVQLESPFDFKRQMEVHLPASMPEPSDENAYLREAKVQICRYIRHTQGRALVLFTSTRWMRDLATRCRAELAGEGYTFYVQGEELPRTMMVDAFRETPRAILFGVDSFWTGVDIPGEALSNVIITRLPFAVPDQPLIQARIRKISQQGGNAFREYSLPEAILKFRQGAGRLIRTSSDRGLLVVLDPRVRTKWYGRFFLKTLPDPVS
jgi:ATP-dependent DNA helicase DinG